MDRFSCRLFRVFLGLVLVLLTVNCSGGADESEKVEVTHEPEEPVAIKAPYTIRPGSDDERVINPPWFHSRIYVKNNSTRALTLVSYNLKIEGFVGAQRVEHISRVDIGQIWEDFGFPESSIMMELAGSGGEGRFPPLTTQFVAVEVPSLLEAEDYAFNVEIEILGWWGTQAEPEERFEKQIFFSTQ